MTDREKLIADALYAEYMQQNRSSGPDFDALARAALTAIEAAGVPADLGFKHGYLIACCNLANLHNEPDMASDVLIECGISSAEVARMDLTDYDAIALREIRKARRLDPIAAPSPTSPEEGA